MLNIYINRSWYQRSTQSTPAGKDTEAKEKIREFYAFATNAVCINEYCKHSCFRPVLFLPCFTCKRFHSVLNSPRQIKVVNKER